MRGNNIVFSLIFLMFFGVVGKLSAHPFYVSVSEIRIDTKKATLTLSCRMFTDDLENALNKIHGGPFDILKSLEDKTTLDFVNEYIQKRFSVGIGGTMMQFDFLGMEQEDEAVWCYLECTNFKSLGSITVTNSLLYDFLPDQVNVIHVYVDDARQSSRLVNPDKVAGFRF